MSDDTSPSTPAGQPGQPGQPGQLGNTEGADCRQLLTYLLAQYERVVAVHAGVVMDTETDRSLHTRAVESFERAADPVRQALAEHAPAAEPAAHDDLQATLARFTAEDAAVAAGRPLTRGEIRAVVKALPHSSMSEVFTDVVTSIVDFPDDDKPATGQVLAQDLRPGQLYRNDRGEWACARTVQHENGQVTVMDWRDEQDEFADSDLVQVRVIG